MAQAVASGDPDIMRRFELERQIGEMQMIQGDRRNQRYRLEEQLAENLPQRVEKIERLIDRLEKDRQASRQEIKEFKMTIEGKVYDNRNKAGIALIALTKALDLKEPREVGEFRGMRLQVHHPSYDSFVCRAVGEGVYSSEINFDSGTGTCTRLENLLDDLPGRLERQREELEKVHTEMQSIKEKLAMPIEGEEELQSAIEELAELEAKLTIKEKEEQAAEQQPEEEEAVLQMDEEMEI